MPRTAKLKPAFRPEREAKGLAPWCVNVPAELAETGNRQQLFFDTKADAAAECEKLKARRDNFGTSLTEMTPARITEAGECYKILAPLGVDLLSAVRSYVASHKARNASIPFLDLFNLYINSRPETGNSGYLGELRITRDRWPKLHKKLASGIAPKDLDAVLAPLTPGARNPQMRYLRAVFNFGIKRGYLAENPVARLDFAPRTKKEIETISVDHVQKMLTHALDRDLRLLPYLVFGFFGGVRPEDESLGIEWRDFDPVDNVLTVREEVAKTGRRRFVKLEDNAVQWLSAYRNKGGTVDGKITPYAESPLRTKRLANRAAAGVARWPNSAMRHTFCSHHLAKFEDINRLTIIIGHTSPTMLWNHYYKAVPKAEVEKFWSIVPDKK
jgi:integrase